MLQEDKGITILGKWKRLDFRSLELKLDKGMLTEVTAMVNELDWASYIYPDMVRSIIHLYCMLLYLSICITFVI